MMEKFTRRARTPVLAVGVAAMLAGAGAAVAASNGDSGGDSTATTTQTTVQPPQDNSAGGRGDFEQALATKLGVSVEKLRAAFDAACQAHPARDAFAAALASELGLQTAEVESALKAVAIDHVNADVAAGRLTEAQAADIRSRIESGDVGPGPGPGFGAGPGGPRGGPGVDAAASFLGMSDSELRSALMSGKSLAQIAKSQGKSVDALVNALVADASEHIKAAVADGQIPQADADKILSDLKQRISDMVNQAGPPDGPQGGMGGPPDGFDGPPPGIDGPPPGIDGPPDGSTGPPADNAWPQSGTSSQDQSGSI